MGFADQARMQALEQRIDSLEATLFKLQEQLITTNDELLELQAKRGPGRPKKEEQEKAA